MISDCYKDLVPKVTFPPSTELPKCPSRCQAVILTANGGPDTEWGGAQYDHLPRDIAQANKGQRSVSKPHCQGELCYTTSTSRSTLLTPTETNLDIVYAHLYAAKNVRHHIICFKRLELNRDMFLSGMRSRDIFCRLRLRLRLRRSIPAPAPALAPSKTFWRLRLWLRLRAKCTGSGGSGSGSGSGSDAQVLIWTLTSNTISKNVKYQNMTSY